MGRVVFIPDLAYFHNCMPHTTTLITTAVTAEAGPLIKALGLRRDRSLVRRRLVYTGHHAGRPIVLAVTGMGREQATHVVESLMRRCGPQRVLISGTAGATRGDLNTGDVILPARVIDADSDELLEPTWLATSEYVLRTGGAVIESAAEKAALYERFGIDAVDMETAAIAGVCEHYQTPWLCARAICDTAAMTLPAGSAKLVNRRGRPRMLGAACYLMRHPGRLKELMRLGEAAKRAAEALARRIPPLLDG